MSLAIRLTRMGRRKSPYYRMVVTENSRARDGRFVEILGYYHPLKKETALEVDSDRALHWLNVGAQPSDTCRSLLRKQGIMQKWHEDRVAARKERRAGQPAATETTTPEA